MSNEIFLDPARVPEHMQAKITDALRFLEYQNGYKILFAYESGSRAWNFHSPDSDYDVRFVYVRNREDYLSVSEGRDVCESFKAQSKGTAYEDPLLDIVGWDLKKALLLMRKSNPQLQEWLNGPLPYYIADPAYVEHLRAISERVTSMQPIYMHYRGMATGNFREYLQGEEVRFKKYLYVIRPLLAAEFVRNYKRIPPVDFNILRQATDFGKSDEFRASLDRLLAFKTQVQESATMPRDPVLNAWIEERLADKVDIAEATKLGNDKVNKLLDAALTSALEKWSR